ncbi:NAD(P)-dependent dehydrogenase [Rathayibacter rathayi]|uniref:NAD(P)-dependent dehydrogenase n=1 Tax=Rathayibacter rathayi TaxID=33887 RepID=A0ABD6W4V0_RATRA|nr:SDR family oxidoreductase [Rathayibacter rathayi]AZZ50584.1 NAD(P)-dependent dehydrogenase [Rathayibacter rathayi]MWV74504.1 SDR family oxidoreductase [Rathayibacter rathayi NCPPB 2980 = VKM Ac-1601]PPF09763.1 NAD(P)-dependent dehydrogenase [Rathayibacter rathayi]PPF41905.1 NAD(P)-dependent dehydrogenase [Rathayibacter rathayi]PPG68736.1 NAD(P)-dependent dehydrogenase [Rathayibacter rathayi]
MPDQYTFTNPATQYPNVTPPIQQQPEPGQQSRMTPVPDLGEESYRGTGAAVAIAVAREGADIALAYLPSEEEDAQYVIELVRAGRTAVPLPGDLTSAECCARLVAEAVEGLGGLDAVVTVAGKQVWNEDVLAITDEQFGAIFAVTVFAPFRIIRAAPPHLPAGATIITTASAEAHTPAPDRLDYAMTTGAINNLSEGLAQQLAAKGIRVNVVAPGPTWTALQVSGGVDPESLPDFGSSEAPMGRAAQPAEQAPAYVFLASAESSFVAGETLNVNGGMVSP